MKETIDFSTSITIDESKMTNIKIGINNLPEEWITEYFSVPTSKLQKHLSMVFMSCLKNIGAAEINSKEEYKCIK